MATYNQKDIIRYVENEMSPAERLQMEADLQQDAALAAGISLYRELKGTLEQRLPGAEGEAALRGALAGMRGKYFPGAVGEDVVRTQDPGDQAIGPSGGRIVPFRKYLAGIAAAASVIVATVLLWPSDGGYLDKFGATQMVSSAERGSVNDSLMLQASAFFNNKEFGKALPLLDQAVGVDTSNREALLYRGIARLHTGAIDAARKDLGSIAEGGTLFRFEAMFYMALSYAQQKDMVTARQWLGRIPEGAPFADQAKELDKKLQ